VKIALTKNISAQYTIIKFRLDNSLNIFFAFCTSSLNAVSETATSSMRRPKGRPRQPGYHQPVPQRRRQRLLLVIYSKL